MKKQLGGDRLGAGGKMDIHLHNYERSTHDLSKLWRSSMAAGTLVPFMTEIALNGDTFDIDLKAMARTLPTVGPLFGSFKLQLDVFEIPMRLYNGLLHNNMLNIGMNMEKVVFPKMEISAKLTPNMNNNRPHDLRQFSSNNLMTYLGVRGLGRLEEQVQEQIVKVKVNAIPVLAYYDIYKNYYANKQEEIGMIVSADPTSDAEITMIHQWQYSTGLYFEIDPSIVNWTLSPNDLIIIIGTNLDKDKIRIDGDALTEYSNDITYTPDGSVKLYANRVQTPITVGIGEVTQEGTGAESGYVKLQEFPLENIDNMRIDILKASGLGVEFNIQESTAYLPYSQVVKKTVMGNSYNLFSQNGLALKTYNSDLFNNWISTEWIDGANGISAVTAVSTTGGEFTIDALNLAQKVYNMLNRIAVSGGSYEDWQEAVYGEQAMRRAETPMYMGGMSSEIVFEEVISNADTQTMLAGEQPLGTLAGKGTLSGNRGGKMTIKVKEPSIIMGIASITPRIDYTQGNRWYMTQLDTMDDLHKPALDAIGFQNLITTQMAWWDGQVDSDGLGILTKSAGKQPAWINYMTNYNEAYGDFADENKSMFMILNRRYKPNENGEIKDLTTYIDPSKYNYAFADTTIESQNFWIQIAVDIKARRKMSAKVIPNL